MLERWIPRKGGKAPTEAALVEQRAALAGEVDELTKAQRKLNASLPELMISDPSQGDKDARQVAEIGVILPAKQRALEMMDNAIVETREKEAAAAAEAERERIYAAGKTAASEHVRLIHMIMRKQKELAADLARACELVDTVTSANTNRGDRPFIRDGEWTLRRKVGKPTPAITRATAVWVDDRGNEVPDQIRVGEGYSAKWISNPAAKEKAWVDKVIQPAHMNPDERREPLTEAIRLVGMKGERLWPR